MAVVAEVDARPAVVTKTRIFAFILINTLGRSQSSLAFGTTKKRHKTKMCTKIENGVLTNTTWIVARMDVNKVRNYLIFLVYIDSMTTINNETRTS